MWMISMEICPNCKSKCDPTDLFCFDCGFSLKTSEIVDQAIKFSKTPLRLDSDKISRFFELEERIEQLETVPDELHHQEEYFQTLNESQMIAKKRLRELNIEKQKEKKDVEKLEKLSITSLVARIKGNRDQQLEKEKIEHLNILNKVEAASKEVDELDGVIIQTRQQIDKLKELMLIKKELKRELENLIHEACEGVPDPIEDEIEGRLNHLNTKFLPLQDRHGRLTRAENHLSHGITDLNIALESLKSASRYSTWDTFFGGGLIADSMKHSRMSDARNRVHHAHMHLQKAIAEVPELPAMGAHVEEISFFWDGFMDNIFSDMAARGKINRSRDSVANALSSATNAVQWVRKEINAIKEDWDTINIQIAETKKELLEERKRMISEALKPGK